MIKYMIIDDEHMAHTIVKGYCDLLPHMQLMTHCYDAFEALDYLRNHSVDLIFLDINMPKLKGFEFLKTLSSPPKVIVTTAYQEYALESYELEVIDYLLKPFGFERFLKALNKVQYTDTSEAIPLKKREDSRDKQIFLYSNKKNIQVKVSHILYIEGAGNYAKVVFADHTLLVREKITDLLMLLSEYDFMQVQKSFLVAKAHIRHIEGNRITLGEHSIPIGKTFREAIDKLLK